MVMVEQDHNYRIDRRNSKKPIGDVTTIYGDWRASPVTKDILSKSPLFTIRGGGEGGGWCGKKGEYLKFTDTRIFPTMLCSIGRIP